MKSISINQDLYKLTIGRYKNAANPIKYYSVEIALDIFEELNTSSALIFTNSVISKDYISSFTSKNKDIFIASHSEQILRSHKDSRALCPNNTDAPQCLLTRQT